MGVPGKTKRIGGNLYHYFRGTFPNKSAALRQAKLMRSDGQLARVTREVYPDWKGGKPTVHWIVWLRKV